MAKENPAAAETKNATEVVKLQAEIKKLNEEKTSISKSLTEEKNAHAKTAKELDSTLKVNEALSKKVAELSKPKKAESSAPKTFKDHSFKDENGHVFGFKLPKVRKDNKSVITFQDVLVSKELQAELVAKRSGMIYPKSGSWPTA